MKKLFVAWQSHNKGWTVVGVLERHAECYKFSYTKGALEAPNFQRFGSMTSDSYTSTDLFPFFKNRLLPNNRPEYSKLLKWMNLDDKKLDALDVLALTEGKRGTDSIELFACPMPQDGKFNVTFFTHGVRHTYLANTNALELIKDNSKVYLMHDIQNEYDKNAMALRTQDPVIFLGYVPRYLSIDIKLLVQKINSDDITLHIKRVNADAPLSYRFLCQLECPWPTGFSPCTGQEYLPISK